MKKWVLGTAIAVCSVWVLAACSPALNWRTVTPKDGSLQLMLPCKPQAQTRAVEMGPGTVQMSMVGCEADGSTFAVTHFLLADPAQAGTVLAYWQKAVLTQLQSGGVPGAQRLQDDIEWQPRGALSLPQSRHIVFTGVSRHGQKVMGDGLWFAQMEGSAARLYHAVIYSDKPDPRVAEMFFSGLKLQ